MGVQNEKHMEEIQQKYENFEDPRKHEKIDL
jgi:hypothetical protein